MSTFSHLDKDGKPSMVDVGNKKATRRTAVAQAVVRLPAHVFDQLVNQNLQSAKGSIIQSSVLAGIMASKKTSELIPLCHPLPLDKCQVDIRTGVGNELVVEAMATVEARTGVEMEALTAASVAALNIYDMCKALSHDIVIKEIKLIKKTGGKSDYGRTGA